MLPDRWPGFVPWGISALLVLSVVAVLAMTGAFSGSSVSYDHEVRLVNDFTESREVQVTVRADNGTAIHENTHRIDPDEETVVFDFQSLEQRGERTYDVMATSGGTNTSVPIQMDDCHGNVLLRIDEDGDLTGTYSIC